MRPFLGTLAALAVLALAACATPPGPHATVPVELFDDTLFGPPTEPVGADRIFALSADMRRYVQTDMAPLVRRHGAQGALVEALYGNGQLKLEYESAVTRSAAEAFEARSGNCLSLVIMTAAFARELGLQVRYQSAYLEETWSRRGSLLLKSGHVNISLGQRIGDHTASAIQYSTTIDFLPPDELRTLKTVEIRESLIVAMFMNNRSVEALVQGRLDDAYAWAREAVRADPWFLAAHNTLGVVYLRRGALARAGAAFEHVLAADPKHTRALANLAEVASRAGRDDEAARSRAPGATRAGAAAALLQPRDGRDAARGLPGGARPVRAGSGAGRRDGRRPLLARRGALPARRYRARNARTVAGRGGERLAQRARPLLRETRLAARAARALSATLGARVVARRRRAHELNIESRAYRINFPAERRQTSFVVCSCGRSGWH
jgi:tetratricopeptide (TPR) repeat protein